MPDGRDGDRRQRDGRVPHQRRLRVGATRQRERGACDVEHQLHRRRGGGAERGHGRGARPTGGSSCGSRARRERRRTCWSTSSATTSPAAPAPRGRRDRRAGGTPGSTGATGRGRHTGPAGAARRRTAAHGRAQGLVAIAGVHDVQQRGQRRRGRRDRRRRRPAAGDHPQRRGVPVPGDAALQRPALPRRQRGRQPVGVVPGRAAAVGHHRQRRPARCSPTAGRRATRCTSRTARPRTASRFSGTTKFSTTVPVQFPAIAIGVDGMPVVAFRDATNGDLRVVHCDDVELLGDGRRRDRHARVLRRRPRRRVLHLDHDRHRRVPDHRLPQRHDAGVDGDPLQRHRVRRRRRDDDDGPRRPGSDGNFTAIQIGVDGLADDRPLRPRTPATSR